jgi:UDPglucose 6-dehydrogenase
MRIGIIGLGVVGSAIRTGFERLGHDVLCHDLKLDSSTNDVIDSEIVFVCVPTPQGDDGSCDTTIITGVLQDLSDKDYKGIVAIKSTVECGYTQMSIDKFKHMTLCFVPEFLRERCAVDDFISNHNLLAVGTDDKFVFNKVVEAHGHYPKETAQLKPTEAEILKYYNNVFAAQKIIFANIMAEVCDKLGCDYTTVKDAFVKFGRCKDTYLDVNENLKGYGGMCLPKDVKAMAKLLEKLNIDFDTLKSVDSDNSKLKTTVFNGMRKH